MSELTQAQAIFKDKQLLIYRPDGMTFAEYKFLQGTQDKVLQKLFAKAPMYKTRRPRIKSKK